MFVELMPLLKGRTLLPAVWGRSHQLSRDAMRKRDLNRGEVQMETGPEDNGESLSLEQATAKAAILAECNKLTTAGVTFMAVHFDGCGHDGTTATIPAADQEPCSRRDAFASRSGHFRPCRQHIH